MLLAASLRSQPNAQVSKGPEHNRSTIWSIWATLASLAAICQGKSLLSSKQNQYSVRYTVSWSMVDFWVEDGCRAAILGEGVNMAILDVQSASILSEILYRDTERVLRSSKREEV